MSAPRILIVRPEAQGLKTAQRLRRIGYDAVLAPILTLRRTGTPPPAGRFDALLLTSANGVPALSDLPQPHPAIFAVGARTAAAVDEAGFGPVTAAEGDAAALAALVARSLSSGSRVLQVAGLERKADPARTLEGLGFAVEIWTAYAAEPLPALPAAAALAGGLIAGALHYSRRSAALLVERADAAGLGAELGGLGHACLSGDVAEPLQTRGFPRIAVAAEPNEDALFVALASLRVTT